MYVDSTVCMHVTYMHAHACVCVHTVHVVSHVDLCSHVVHLCAQSTGTTCSSNVPRYQSNASDRRANQVMAKRDACTGNLTCLGAFTFSLD